MIQFTTNLKKEIDAKIEEIESSEISAITKSLKASRMLAEAFNRLKTFILSYAFNDEEEEIMFFKEIKPKLCYRLIYYRKVYNIEMNRPAGVEKQKEYLCEKLDEINKYNSKRLDFIRYYRSGSTHLDSLYFLRGKTDPEQYLETFYYELDSNFSTNCDFKVAKIWANDLLSAYLMNEIELLNDNGISIRSFNFPATKKRGKEVKRNYRNKFTHGIVPVCLVMYRSHNFLTIYKTCSTSSWTVTFRELSAI